MTSTKMVVTVKRLVPENKLDRDDQSEDGRCAVEGDYLVEVCHSLRWGDKSAKDHLDEVALDIFHNRIPIAMLENYDITVDTLEPSQDTTLMEEL